MVMATGMEDVFRRRRRRRRRHCRCCSRAARVVVVLLCDRRARSSYRHKPTEPEERSELLHRITHTQTNATQSMGSVAKKQKKLG